MSESVTISLSRPRKPKSIGSLLKETRQQRRVLEKLSLPLSGQAPEPAPQVLPGHAYKLARRVRDRLGDERFIAGRFYAALEDECRKFVKKNGGRLTPRSLWQNLRRVDCWQCCKPLKECICNKKRSNVAAKKPS